MYATGPIFPPPPCRDPAPGQIRMILMCNRIENGSH